MSTPDLALIGAGRMGSAMALGWIASGRDPSSFFAVDPRAAGAGAAALRAAGVRIVPRLEAADAAGLKTVVMAVKPQTLDEAAGEIASLLPADAMVLSILAGRTLERLGELFGARPLVRAMPNTPAAVGKGYSVYVASAATPRERKDEARDLLAACGGVAALDAESQMDAVTAVSGSGPAYFFLMTEALAAAGMQEGLPRELAEALARATLVGSGALLEAGAESPTRLREAVTSPKGTTAAALDVLNHEHGLPALLRRAVAAATARSKELRG